MELREKNTTFFQTSICPKYQQQPVDGVSTQIGTTNITQEICATFFYSLLKWIHFHFFHECGFCGGDGFPDGHFPSGGEELSVITAAGRKELSVIINQYYSLSFIYIFTFLDNTETFGLCVYISFNNSIPLVLEPSCVAHPGYGGKAPGEEKGQKWGGARTGGCGLNLRTFSIVRSELIPEAAACV